MQDSIYGRNDCLKNRCKNRGRKLGCVPNMCLALTETVIKYIVPLGAEVVLKNLAIQIHDKNCIILTGSLFDRTMSDVWNGCLGNCMVFGFFIDAGLKLRT